MKKINIENLDFKKLGGLLPVVIQDISSKQVLMLGFMNKQALKYTLRDKKVYFWSRTRKCLWKKGETSGNFLEVISIEEDCDKDTLLIYAKPAGPVCHTGNFSCFGGPSKAKEKINYLSFLYKLVQKRKMGFRKNSYTCSLFKDGLDKIVQKVGEESSEVIIAAKNSSEKRLIEEMSDLFFHLIVLMVEKKISFNKIEKELKKRHLKKK